MPTPVLTKNKSGVFEARWSTNRRTRRKSMGTQDSAAAEARFAQWLLMGGHKEEQAGETSTEAKLTIGELWAVYERLHIHPHVEAKRTAYASWRNLAGVFSDMEPADVSQDVVDGYVGRRLAGKIGKPSKPSTTRRELSALQACLNWCANPKRKPRYITEKDVPAFELPPASDPRDRWLSTEEMARMHAAATAMRRDDKLTRDERFLWLALQTAARKQAILDLTWDRVDFEVGMIHFNVPGRKKTKKRRVSVPMSKALRPILEQAHKERENELVMTNKNDMWARVQLIAIKAGLGVRGPKRVGKGHKILATGISPHTLRHTAATHMARRGVPLYTIAGVLGNTLAMVEKVYAKHCPAALRDAVNAISGELDG
jgi:integrase